MFQTLKNEGTVKPALNFNPSGDAAVLDKAIKTKGEAEMHEGRFGACASMLWCCNVSQVLSTGFLGFLVKNLNALCWPSYVITFRISVGSHTPNNEC